MIHPTKADLGRAVVYREPGRPGPEERGVLTEFNEHYAFVRYGNDKHGKATRFADLAWVIKAPAAKTR